jgi:transcriptional regulator with XRE-family HTH domain
MEQAPLAQASEVAPARIREVRARRGLSQRDLARILDADFGYVLDAPTISKIEKRARSITLDDLLAIAAALNVSPLALLTPPPPITIAIGRRAMQMSNFQDWARAEIPAVFNGDLRPDPESQLVEDFYRESLSYFEYLGATRAPAALALRAAATALLLQLGLERTMSSLRIEDRPLTQTLARAQRDVVKTLESAAELAVREAQVQIEGSDS